MRRWPAARDWSPPTCAGGPGRTIALQFAPLGGFHTRWRSARRDFCYLNDVVLACMKLAGAGKRVLYST